MAYETIHGSGWGLRRWVQEARAHSLGIRTVCGFGILVRVYKVEEWGKMTTSEALL